MTPEPQATKEVVVKVLVRGVPVNESPLTVGLEVYKAAVEALCDRYVIMGYSYE